VSAGGRVRSEALAAWTADRRGAIEATLDRLLPAPAGPAATLAAAMRHAVLGGGKRLRALLTLAACEACGGRPEDALDAAAAVEMLHAYSLVHDDLPAMDDDDFRRGRPTTHRVYGDAMAILAGDALQTLAFETLAGAPSSVPADRRVSALAALARAAGWDGMVGGQAADLEAEGRAPRLEAVEWIHGHKTGALLAASTEIGAIFAGAEAPVVAALGRFGGAVGFAFQVVDDILDVTATAAVLGKTPGKDGASGKATYPALVGVDAARREADAWIERALREIAPHVVDGRILTALARYALERSH